MKKLCYLGIDPSTGRQIRKWVSGNTEKDILNAEITLKVQYKTGQIAAKDLKFDKWAQTWQDANYPEGKGNPNTRRMYILAVTHLKKGFGGYKLSQIRPIHVDQYFASRSSRSGEIELMVLRRICKAARVNHCMVDDPTAGKTIQYSKAKKRNLEIYERTAIKKAVMRPKDLAFVNLALRCGLRRGEILALFPEDISTKVRVAKGAIILKTGMTIRDTPKTDAGNRLVPIPADALVAIQDYAKTIPNGQPLFGWLKRHTYWKLWHNIMAKINDTAGGSCHFDVKKKYRVIDTLALRLPFSAHVLRHSYCCDLVRAGYSLDQIKYLMGHSKITMSLDVYNHVKGEEITAGRLDKKPVTYRIVSGRTGSNVHNVYKKEDAKTEGA